MSWASSARWSCTTSSAASGWPAPVRSPRRPGPPRGPGRHVRAAQGRRVLLGPLRAAVLGAQREGGEFSGASYTDLNAAMPAKQILMIIAVICAIASSPRGAAEPADPGDGAGPARLSSAWSAAAWPAGRAVRGAAERDRPGGGVHRAQHRGDARPRVNNVGARPTPPVTSAAGNAANRPQDVANTRHDRTTSGCSTRAGLRTYTQLQQVTASTASARSWTSTGTRSAASRGLRGRRPGDQL